MLIESNPVQCSGVLLQRGKVRIEDPSKTTSDFRGTVAALCQLAAHPVEQGSILLGERTKQNNPEAT